MVRGRFQQASRAPGFFLKPLPFPCSSMRQTRPLPFLIDEVVLFAVYLEFGPARFHLDGEKLSMKGRFRSG